MRPRLRHLRLPNYLLASVLGAACTNPGDRPPAGDSALAQMYVYNTDNSLTIAPPGRWMNAFRTDTLSTSERGMALPGALNLVYLPVDSSVIPQTLVVVAVYDSAAWQAVKADGGPPPGDSIKSHNGRVYVLSLPQSNPFEPGSVDALRFDSLTLTAAEKERLIKVP